jgi:hypothetical protein
MTVAEHSMLITIVTFLGIFFVLSASMPATLIVNPQDGRVVDVPEYFEGIDIQSYANTYVINLSDPNNLEQGEFTFGGWEMKYSDWNPPDSLIWIRTQAEWFIFRWDFQYFKWHDKEGVERSQVTWIGEWHEKQAISYEALDNAYESWGREGLRWTLRNVHTQIVVYVGFNETKYVSPSDALNGGELSLLLCINFDKINTSFNAWNLIGQLLFFQLPNVHPVLNVIIAIPLWAGIAYLIYVLILKVIPFVGG